MIWSLQILRFVAAMMVVWLHVAQSAALATASTGTIPIEIAGMGQAGVDIFFVLSGVVITRTAPGMTPGNFLWRRFRRILPIYFVACSLAMLQAVKVGFGWREALATVLLWPATDVMTAPVLAVAWTLSFEMLFYLAAALVLLNRRWIYVLGVSYLAAFALRPFGPIFQILGNPIVLEFLFGVAIAMLPSSRLGAICLPLGFAALVLVGLFHLDPKGEMIDSMTGKDSMHRVLVWGLPSSLIVYGCMQIKARQSLWTHFGDASYSIYLFHGFAIGLLLLVWSKFPVHPDLIIILDTLAAFLLSWRIHVLFEVPLLRAIPKNIPKTAGVI